MNLLLINVRGPEKRVAFVESGRLAEFQVERRGDRGNVGNIYKGRVIRVLPGMQAAFVDIGMGKAAFLGADDVMSEDGEQESPQADNEEETEKPRPLIADTLTQGQEILVQVAKEPIGTKGARVTNYLSLPSRHLVLMPSVDHVGLSRRIGSEEERVRLKEIVDRNRPEGVGLIVRTVAEGRGEGVLQEDLAYLTKLWDKVSRQAEQASVPSVVYRDLDLVLRVVRDQVGESIERVIVDDRAEHKRIAEFAENFMPHFKGTVEYFGGDTPIFDAFGVEHEIDRALDRKVWLKSGGYIIIDESEALTAIDVNTGRYVGRRNLEDTITKINLEAAKEVVNQLRLRNIGGIVIIDFIDMQVESNKHKVWQALSDALESDRAKTNVLQISGLGLVEMTRQRVRESLTRRLADPCGYCEGRGFTKTAQTVCYEVLRELDRQARSLPTSSITVQVNPSVADLLADAESEYLTRIEGDSGRLISVEPVRDFHLERFEISVGT